MIETQCAVCQGKTPFSVLYKENFNIGSVDKNIFSARRLPDRIHYRMVQCNACGLVYSNPILEQEKIKQLYQESEFTYDEQVPFLKQTYGKYLQKMFKYLKQKKSLLEIGCGNGFFLEEAKQLGFKQVFGVEPSTDAANKAREDIKPNIRIGYLEDLDFQENSFDAICVFQTFDHLLDPNKFLDICFRILKPGGLVLAINHNISHFFAKLLGERCPMIDIEHTYLYNPNTFRTIFENHHFNVSDIFGVNNVYPLSYWLRLLPIPAKTTLLARLPKFILNWTLSINAGNMGIIARKP